MTAVSDLDLVKAFQDGDERAFNELVRRYQEKLYWIARRFLNDHDEADDVVQETFIKVHQALGDFRGDASLFTWLYRITVNASLNAVRRNRVRSFFKMDDVLEAEAGPEEAPDLMVERDEQRRLIEKAVERLPEKQKAVFILRYYDELPYEQISKILKTTVGGLKANYFHAVKKIADYVQRAHDAR